MNFFKNETKKLNLSMLLLPALLIVGIFVYSGQTPVLSAVETAVSSAAEPNQPFTVTELPPEALAVSKTLENSIINSAANQHPKMDASLVQLTTAVSPTDARDLAKDSGVRLEDNRLVQHFAWGWHWFFC